MTSFAQRSREPPWPRRVQRALPALLTGLSNSLAARSVTGNSTMGAHAHSSTQSATRMAFHGNAMAPSLPLSRLPCTAQRPTPETSSSRKTPRHPAATRQRSTSHAGSVSCDAVTPWSFPWTYVNTAAAQSMLRSNATGNVPGSSQTIPHCPHSRADVPRTTFTHHCGALAQALASPVVLKPVNAPGSSRRLSLTHARPARTPSVRASHTAHGPPTSGQVQRRWGDRRCHNLQKRAPAMRGTGGQGG